ncbi:hypothetical protein CQ018_01585 [Arthrobacter sp. MYb227]|uniref:hypothetical protein n=1 Tax=Arthrobacter sp. MYb227 TaxID=1848601 RepID=UPI000CFE1A30|nr:hypothetical protein [Arthrobacter sp. MYb227]PQZ96005.1 hypothetical protein CQ018_01585 [Arthrobacter sp. MYb227]
MAPAAPKASVASSAKGQVPLRIYYDRVAIALLGCLSVLTLVIGGVLALAGVFSGWVPLIGLLVGVGSFAALRVIAVRARRAKLLARMESTRKLAMETVVEPVTQSPKKQTAVFDAQPNSNKRAPRLTVEELRAEALRIAAKGSPIQRPAAWEPTEVPLPQYVMKNAVQRPTPEAIEPAAVLKASTNATLRAQEASKQLAKAVEAAAQPPETTSISEGVEKSIGAKSTSTVANSAPAVPEIIEADAVIAETSTAKSKADRVARDANRMNLDDVMQRRRA